MKGFRSCVVTAYTDWEKRELTWKVPGSQVTCRAKLLGMFGSFTLL